MTRSTRSPETGPRLSERYLVLILALVLLLLFVVETVWEYIGPAGQDTWAGAAGRALEYLPIGLGIALGAFWRLRDLPLGAGVIAVAVATVLLLGVAAPLTDTALSWSWAAALAVTEALAIVAFLVFAWLVGHGRGAAPG